MLHPVGIIYIFVAKIIGSSAAKPSSAPACFDKKHYEGKKVMKVIQNF